MKTGNDLVAEQVHYSTCLCSLSNYANQRNLAVLQRIVIYLLYSSLGCIDNFYPFTGLSYIDIKTLTFDKIQRMDFDGEEWIITRRTKTKVSSNVPLMEIAKELIERYKGLAKDDFVFPMPSNGTCNDHLKKIATVCGINKEVTFHLSRHSSFLF